MVSVSLMQMASTTRLCEGGKVGEPANKKKTFTMWKSYCLLEYLINVH